MKSAKKILAIYIVLALILSAASVSFAAVEKTTEEKAQVLYQLGLLKGTNPDVFTPNLEGVADRAQAMVMVGRALGWAGAADWNADAISGYSDVLSWAQPFVAYAVKIGVTNGVGGNLFGSGSKITSRQLKTWLDRALGMGDTWMGNYIFNNTVALTRKGLVDYTWIALKMVPNGSDKTLIELIIGSDPAMLQIARDADLME